MKTKKCFRCNKRRPLDQFYKHPQMSDGYLGKCKSCARSDVLANRRRRRDYYVQYDRERNKLPHRVAAVQAYSKTDRGREVHNRASRRWAERNAFRRAAQIAVGNAIRDGRLKKSPCERCGSKRVHAHHDDYLKPFEVRWLCAKHHKEEHARQESAFQEEGSRQEDHQEGGLG